MAEGIIGFYGPTFRYCIIGFIVVQVKNNSILCVSGYALIFKSWRSLIFVARAILVTLHL